MLSWAGAVGVPAMPTATRKPQPHREKIRTLQAPFNAAVARPVAKKEMYANPKALKAVRSEWDRLRLKKCWSEDLVREWKHVAAEARDSETTVHVGRLCCICVETGSKLKPDDEREAEVQRTSGLSRQQRKGPELGLRSVPGTVVLPCYHGGVPFSRLLRELSGA